MNAKQNPTLDIRLGLSKVIVQKRAQLTGTTLDTIRKFVGLLTVPEAHAKGYVAAAENARKLLSTPIGYDLDAAYETFIQYAQEAEEESSKSKRQNKIYHEGRSEGWKRAAELVDEHR